MTRLEKQCENNDTTHGWILASKQLLDITKTQTDTKGNAIFVGMKGIKGICFLLQCQYSLLDF